MLHVWFVISLMCGALAGRAGAVVLTVASNSTSQIVGTDALFSISFSGNNTVPSVEWHFINRIVIWTASNTASNTTRQEYDGRLVLFTNGSFILRAVQLLDSGTYNVIVVDSRTSDGTASISLSVYEVISTVTLQMIPQSLPQYGSSLVLQCSVLNITEFANLSFTFYKYNAVLAKVTAVRLNATYAIPNITFSQRGNYSCYVENPISNGTSTPLQLELECNTTDSPTLTVPSSSIISTSGQSSMLSLSYTFFGKSSVSWTFGGLLVASWVLPGNGAEPQEFSEGAKYIGRTSASANGSLGIKVVQDNDRGSYTFLAMTCMEKQSTVVLTLTEDPWPATRSAIIGGVVGGVGGLLLLLLILLLILLCRRKRREKKSPPKATKRNAKNHVENVRRMERPPPQQQQPWTTSSVVDVSNAAYGPPPDRRNGDARAGADDWRTDRSSIGPHSIGESSLPMGADFSYTNGNARSTKPQDPLDFVGFPDSLSEPSDAKTAPKFRAMTAV